jgi:hypothetical protein
MALHSLADGRSGAGILFRDAVSMLLVVGFG